MLIALTVSTLFSIAAHGDVIHVPGELPTIQAGIDFASSGDTVLVADGTYSGPGNRDLDFGGKALALRSMNGPENCVIDCGGSPAEHHRGFIFHNGEGPDSVVQGFTISNGDVDDPDDDGGGISCENGSSPTITGNTITENTADFRGGAIYCYDSSAPTITHNTITGNTAYWGGGIHCDYESTPLIANNVISGNDGRGISFSSSPTITGNIITDNTSPGRGAGIDCFYNSAARITNNIITGNDAQENGGGIFIHQGFPLIANNLIAGNSAVNPDDGQGGGFYCERPTSFPLLFNNTIVNNAAIKGGGMCITNGSSPVVFNTILWNNQAERGPEIRVGTYLLPSTLTINYSLVEGGLDSVDLPGGIVDWGEEMIDADPLLVSGPLGDHYLSHVAAGQTENSPCIDTGDEMSGMIWGSTRTDHVLDIEADDMGFHFPGFERLVVGPGPGYDNPPLVRVIYPLQAVGYEYEFSAYGVPRYGVNISCGDLDGDGLAEILTGAGPGAVFGPHVRGFQVDGTSLPGLSYLAYGTNKYGVNVAAGDLDGDSFDEIVTGAGPGAVFGPHVRGWNYDGTGEVAPIPGVSYFAYGTPKWGVNVSAGDIDGDGYDEIVTGAGPGAVYGPHVRGWNVDGGVAAAIPGVNFFAYGTLKYGVNVTCGDVDGDGIDEIVTGAGPGAVFGPHVRGWNVDGGSATAMANLSFFAWPAEELRYGANVFSGADLNGNGRDEIVVGCGPDPEAGSEVKVYKYDGSGVNFWFSLEAFTDMTHGTNVAAGRF